MTPRKIVIRRIASRWTWVCHLCEPACHGATWHWAKTLANVGRHCERRRYHHAYVRRYHRAA